VKRKAFTMIELLVVIGVIAILLSLMLPALFAHMEGARIQEMQDHLKVIEAALAQYHGAFGDYPPSPGDGTNSGSESLLACLRTQEVGGPFIEERLIRSWVGDSDGDGEPELIDPWQNPWVYFHPSDYTRGAVEYKVKGKAIPVSPCKKGDVYKNLTSYQLWACGPNQSSEAGQGDDAGNLER